MVKNYGCPTSAVSTVLTGLGINCSPNDFVEVIPRDGVANSIINKGVKLKQYNTLPSNYKDIIIGHLQEGFPIVIYEQSPSIFTKSEHWMAILDVNSDGSKVYIASGSSSKKAGWYDIDTALKGLKRIYLVSK